jgi:hypothetical protein
MPIGTVATSPLGIIRRATMNDAQARAGTGPVQVGAVFLTLATASIHLYLFLIEGYLGSGTMLPIYQLLFINNILAYVTLAVALVLPISPLPQIRPLMRTALTAIAVASIVSYFYVGVTDLLGNIDKVIEILLIVLLTINAAMSGQELGGRFPRGVLGAAVQLVVGVVLGIGMFLFLRPLLV